MRPAPNITKLGRAWAMQHDWFRDSHKLNNTQGLYKVVVRDESSTMGIRYFENLEELRAWAGY